MQKKIMKWGLGIGLAIIVVAGGLVAYKSYGFKREIEALLNQQMQKYQQSFASIGVMEISPTECKGLVYIECKNAKMKMQTSEGVVEIKNITAKLDDFARNEIQIVGSAEIQTQINREFAQYSKLISPVAVHTRWKINKQTSQDYQMDAKWQLQAPDFALEFGGVYQGKLELPNGKNFWAYVMTSDGQVGDVMRLTMGLENTGEFDQVLYDVVKEQKGYRNISRNEYNQLIPTLALVLASSVTQDSQIQKAIVQFANLLVGKQKEISISLDKKEQGQALDWSHIDTKFLHLLKQNYHINIK
ncbi:hypothetical protein BBW65_07555 [Helicobacter enhydrae]|uniref:Uncharacterized protein n=1 Tax=Helicobacter enhydrae TaxID=222136 RepID=A0A1B1U7F6_9HELI|nr:hypothetical protein [Helicobacter enhydrae]ANV98661.1 hypothetical protein BBW65_07555 [Helicobacter enhydrae]